MNPQFQTAIDHLFAQANLDVKATDSSTAITISAGGVSVGTGGSVKARSGGTSGSALAGMVAAYFKLEQDFLPQEDKSRMFALVLTPNGSTAEFTDRQLRKAEKDCVEQKKLIASKDGALEKLRKENEELWTVVNTDKYKSVRTVEVEKEKIAEVKKNLEARLSSL